MTDAAARPGEARVFSVTVAETAARGLSRLSKDAEAGEDIVVARHGKAVGALVSMRHLESLQRLGAVANDAMGMIFEDLLRRFSEMSNETAGEHFSPREVIQLMVNVLFAEDDEALRGEKPVRTLYDGACGTGGMLGTGCPAGLATAGK